MSKISDNASEGSYHTTLENKKKAQLDKFRHTKQGPLVHGSMMVNDLKIEGGKTQSFHSDVEESYSNAGASI